MTRQQMRRTQEQLRAAVEYVRAHPGCNARRVAEHLCKRWPRTKAPRLIAFYALIWRCVREGKIDGKRRGVEWILNVPMRRIK